MTLIRYIWDLFGDGRYCFSTRTAIPGWRKVDFHLTPREIAVLFPSPVMIVSQNRADDDYTMYRADQDFGFVGQLVGIAPHIGISQPFYNDATRPHARNATATFPDDLIYFKMVLQ